MDAKTKATLDESTRLLQRSLRELQRSPRRKTNSRKALSEQTTNNAPLNGRPSDDALYRMLLTLISDGSGTAPELGPTRVAKDELLRAGIRAAVGKVHPDVVK